MARPSSLKHLVTVAAAYVPWANAGFNAASSTNIAVYWGELIVKHWLCVLQTTDQSTFNRPELLRAVQLSAETFVLLFK